MNVPDQPIINALNRFVPWWQDRTGIPKWRLMQIWLLGVCLPCVGASVIGIASASRWPEGFWWLFGGLVNAFNTRNVIAAPPGRLAQCYADERLLIVPGSCLVTELFSSGMICVLRWLILLFLGSVVAAGDIWLAVSVGSSVIFLYFWPTDTFPMTGPTLRERLKNLLRFRRAVPVMSA